MNTPWTIALSAMTISSVVGFLAMGYDKYRAHSHSRRIPEKTLFELALIGGAFGILLGAKIFHHKTMKVPFMVAIILIAAGWLIGLFLLLTLLPPPLG